jgi:hypothetical protein
VQEPPESAGQRPNGDPGHGGDASGGGLLQEDPPLDR